MCETLLDEWAKGTAQAPLADGLCRRNIDGYVLRYRPPLPWEYNNACKGKLVVWVVRIEEASD